MRPIYLLRISMRLYHEYSEKSKYEHQLKDQGAWSVEAWALASPKIYLRKYPYLVYFS